MNQKNTQIFRVFFQLSEKEIYFFFFFNTFLAGAFFFFAAIRSEVNEVITL